MDAVASKLKVTPFSLKDAPSLIERVWPAQKISVEAQKERKAVKGQTLTGLGSYWKGRKPLILVRACVLGALLPSTGNDEKDLAIFETLCGMADDQVQARFKTMPTVAEVNRYATPEQRTALFDGVNGNATVKRMAKDERIALISSVIERMPYQLRSEKLARPEEVQDRLLTKRHFEEINKHLGAGAHSVDELVEQLGTARFGARPRVGDVFCGGGSIPFEAARLGCDVYATDLNPIACLLTWGALHVVGASPERRAQLADAEVALISTVEKEIEALGIERDSAGNRAKAYLYCIETRCPHTGWMVPLSPSWVISKSKKVIAVLVPDPDKKRYGTEVRQATSDAEFVAASKGTIQGGYMVHEVDGELYSTPIRTLRGDRRGSNGETVNDLRLWEKTDFAPRPDDLFRERLYAIQWMKKETLSKPRPTTFFTSVRGEDEARESRVGDYVSANLASWQAQGLVPDLRIEPGEKTTELIRTRGWTYWHHVFTPRDYIILAALLKHNHEPEIGVLIPSLLNHASKLCQWATTNAPLDAEGNQAGGARDLPNHVFYNQAFNTFWNYASRASSFLLRDIRVSKEVPTSTIHGIGVVRNLSALVSEDKADIFITDPPYADAIRYHEISEFFIAWLRKHPAEPFKEWVSDSGGRLRLKAPGMRSVPG